MRSAITSHPVRTGIIVVVAVFLALLGARMAGAEPVRGDVAGFHQRVQTDRDSYAVGESVHVTYTVCRTLPWPAVTSSTGGTNTLVSWRVVSAAGTVVADNSHVIHTLEGRSAAWLPGQCRSTQFGWDQHHWNRDADGEELPWESNQERAPVVGVPVVGDRVAPGSYRVEVRWRTGQFDDLMSPQSEVSSTSFQIEP